MASIPQQQFVNAFSKVKSKYMEKKKSGLYDYPSGDCEFGRGQSYFMWYNGKLCRLYHYNTLIYECDFKTKKFKIGGYSMSDVNAIESMGRITGIGGAYIQDGVLYKKGTGPRYKKKTARPKTNEFGFLMM